MARYFSDLDNGKIKYVDNVGTELAGIECVANEALGFLSTVFKDGHRNDENHNITVSVRNERNQVVYRSTLTLQTVWLDAGMAPGAREGHVPRSEMRD